MIVLQQQLDSPRMWSIAARLMTLYAKTFPGSDGRKAINWYSMAAAAADRSEVTDIRVWVRGRAAIALGYEGAALPVAHRFADQALAISDRPGLGRLNALWGKAHAAALQGDTATARGLIDTGRREFDRSGSDDQASDYAVPWWRVNVFLPCWLPASARNGSRWRPRKRRGRICRSRCLGSARTWICIKG